MTEIFLAQPQDYLRLELELRKSRRRAYSMRAFARDLEMSPASLATFLAGKSGVSLERAQALAKMLNWGPERLDHFWDLVQAKFAQKTEAREQAAERVAIRIGHLNSRISVDSFHLISDWQNLAILTYLQMQASGASEDEVADRFRIEKKLVGDCLARLARLELATENNGVWLALRANTHTGDEGPSDATRHFHHQILDLAHQALDNTAIWESDKSLSVVYSIERRHMPKVRREIREAVIKILTEYSKVSKDDDVQVLTLQMFSLLPPSRFKANGPEA